MKRALLEAALIAAITLLYSLGWAPGNGSLNAGLRADTEGLQRLWSDENLRPTGLEQERLAGAILPFRIGLTEYGHLPAWNPYLGSGVPLFNNAFNYLFNPFHSLPLLLLGPVAGSKVALLLALLLAGLNMAALARTLGMGSLATVLAAGLWLSSGQIAGKFYAGHFQLGLSLAWPPLVLATLLWTLRSRSKGGPLAFGISFALLFYAGNVTYTLHTLLWVGGLAAAGLWIATGARRATVRRLAAAAGLAFGLSALLFVPVWQTRAFVSHEAQRLNPDGSLEGHYSLSQAVGNLLQPWDQWRELENAPVPLTTAVDYAYIGGWAVLLAGCGSMAVFSRRRESARKGDQALWMAVMALTGVMLIWAAGESGVVAWLYARVPLLAEFRFVGRALAFAALGCILLAAVALDRGWKAAGIRAGSRRITMISSGLAGAAAVYALAYSLSNTSGRLALVGNQFGLLNALDGMRWQSLRQASDGLWALGGLAVLISLLVGRPSADTARGRLGRRIAAAAIIILALVMLRDSLMTNNLLYRFEPMMDDDQAAYAQISAWDDGPFPAVNLPFSPWAYEAYSARIRNWGLDEGWEPAALPGLIPEGNSRLSDLPRWAVVPYAPPGDLPEQLAQDFVSSYGYRARACLPRVGSAADCGQDGRAALWVYERAEALPYAFIVSEARLTGDAANLQRGEVMAATVLEHRMDTIRLQARAPVDGAAYYLVVQETHFPGWRARIDGMLTSTTTAQTGQSGGLERGFVALRMLPGEHQVELVFEAPGLAAGLAVFTLTLMSAGLWLGRGWIQARRH